MAEPERAPLFGASEIRTAFIVSGIGMVAVLVLILLLASSRPQGSLQSANDERYRMTLAAATENLEGYELIGENRARIDLNRAIELVSERGVDLSLTAIGTGAPADAAADAGDAAEGEDGAAAEGPTEVDGEAVFAENCAACHQQGGQGIPGAFPPLAQDNLPNLLAAEGGRDYLIRAVLYGVQGQIEVDGQTFDGVMPAWPQLSDEEIAAMLHHGLTAWGNELPQGEDPITPDQVAAARGEELSASDVHELRP